MARTKFALLTPFIQRVLQALRHAQDREAESFAARSWGEVKDGKQHSQWDAAMAGPTANRVLALSSLCSLAWVASLIFSKC